MYAHSLLTLNKNVLFLGSKNGSSVYSGQINVRAFTKSIYWNEIRNGCPIESTLIGDSIVKNVTVSGITTYSIPGAQVFHFLEPEVLEVIAGYKNVIIGSLGGNNLRTRDGNQIMDPYEVIKEIDLLKQKLNDRQCRVIVCTVCARYDNMDGTQREDIKELNKYIMDKGRYQFFNMHKYVYSINQDYRLDAVHLSDIGIWNYCKGIKNLRKMFEF